MSKDEALVAWYEARDVFLGLNGNDALFWKGRQMVQECLTKYGDNACHADAKWFCSVIPHLDSMTWINPAKMVERFMKDAERIGATDYESGRALCFAALTATYVDTIMIRTAAQKLYPLAVGFLARHRMYCLDSTNGRRSPGESLYVAAIQQSWDSVHVCASDKWEDPRCMYAIAYKATVTDTDIMFYDDPRIPRLLEQDSANRARVKRAAELGLRSAQLFHGLHSPGLADSERLYWLGKAARGKHNNEAAAKNLRYAVRESYTKFFCHKGWLNLAESARCIYQIGLLTRALVRDGHFLHPSRTHDASLGDDQGAEDYACGVAHRCLHTQEEWARQARAAVDAWTMIAKRGTFVGVSKDIRKMVGMRIWALRWEWKEEP